ETSRRPPRHAPAHPARDARRKGDRTVARRAERRPGFARPRLGRCGADPTRAARAREGRAGPHRSPRRDGARGGGGAHGLGHGALPPDPQERFAKDVVSLFGFRKDTWRLDPTEHPFASGAGVDDIRITTHYDPGTMKSFFSTMHEYGHGLYSQQLPRHLERLPIGNACSLGIHESQTRLWENLVGRRGPFWRFFYP